MKIIHMVGDYLPPGGFQYGVHHFCNGLSDLGHEVVLMARSSILPLPPSIFDKEEARYRVHRYFLPPTHGRGYGWFGRRALQKLRRRFDADIVHCTMGWPCPAWLLDGPPLPGLIAMFQGADLQVFPEMNYGYRLDPERNRDILRIAKECPNLLVLSRAMKTQIVELGAPAERVEVMPNGVDCSLYQGPQPSAPVDYPYIFAMGRLFPLKSYDLLIEAFASVAGKIPSEIRLCIAGKGEEEEKLRQLAKARGVGDRVVFVGYVTAEQKVAWLRNALFFAHPSRREALGIVNLEAQAAGLPVIAFAVDGLLDIVDEGENGFLVPPYETTILAERLQTLCENKELRDAQSKKALEKAATFDWSAVVRRLEIYYDTLLRRIHH